MNESFVSNLRQYFENKGITQRSVAEVLGVSPAYINKLLSGKKAFGKKTAQQFQDLYGLSASWLLTGDGDMLKNDSNTSQPNKGAFYLRTIKYYPNVDGAMGGVQFLDNPDETAIDMSIPGYTDCKFAINAYGESMSPLIKSGQIVLLAEWRERFIDWGKIYLVVTKSGYRVIKRLFPGVTEETIVCRSENKVASPDFEVDVDDILHIYLVKGWVCRDVI